jgi:hypothetical protein
MIGRPMVSDMDSVVREVGGVCETDDLFFHLFSRTAAGSWWTDRTVEPTHAYASLDLPAPELWKMGYRRCSGVPLSCCLVAHYWIPIIECDR